VTITGLTLNADWPTGTCAANRYGILVGDEADLILTRDTITGAGVSPLSSCDSGVAVQVGRSAAPSQVGAAKLTEDTISGYQQAGIVVDGTGSTATATAVTVSGAGETTELAQTGIEVSDGAKATVTRSSVTGNECSSTECGSNALTEQQGVGVRFFGAAAGSRVTSSTISSNDVGVAYQDTETTAPTASQVAISSDTLDSDRYEGVLLDQGWATVGGDTLESGNVGIEVLQRSGQSYGEHGTGSRDTISHFSQWAVEGLSDQHSGDPAGLFTISASQISGNPAHTVAGSVHSNSSNLVITTSRSDS
jgi:hypothetical protein